MESPVATLSRSPSSSSFAPGSHRRSHPNLHHLSLAPLTPKYPIDPADYSPYFDPETSELHTSASISHISGLPSPGGILANSPARSRANSRTRLKKRTRSHVSINLPERATVPSTSTPSGALTSHGFGHSTLRPTNSHTKSTSRSHLHLGDSDWLVQTGLTLTASSRENKGQSWIAQRESSTSLASSHTAHEERQPRSGRTTPFGSRPASRVSSRAGSRATSRTRKGRRDLAMTSAGPSQLHLSKMMSEEDVQPDWADKETQAEIAARVASEMSDELDDDPYGLLNFEDQVDLEFDTEDEEEIRRELAEKGGWFDGVVDVFLKLEEDYPDPEPDLEKGEEGPEDGSSSAAPQGKKQKDEPLKDEEVEAPPEQPQGVWDDVKWFGRMLVRTVRS